MLRVSRNALMLLVVFGLASRETATTTEDERLFDGLIAAGDAVVAVEILSTDYTAIPADGPMIAAARALKVLKGPLTKGRRFTFAETAWVGPRYQKGEYRILFLERAKAPEALKASRWWILSHLQAKSDFFIDKDAIPGLSPESLEALVKESAR